MQKVSQPDVQIALAAPLEGRAHPSRSNSAEERNGRGREPAGDERSERGDNTAPQAPERSHREQSIGETQHAASNGILGAPDLEQRQSTNTEDPSKFQHAETGTVSLRVPEIRVSDLREPSSQNPFAHLDALYHHIFSQVAPVEVLEKVREIIAYVINGYSDMMLIPTAFLLEPGELDVLFADLTPIILCEPATDKPAEVKFLHASLPDFLIDKTRSDQYHIDLDEYRTTLLCRLLEGPLPISDPLWSGDDLEALMDRELTRLRAIRQLLAGEKQGSERLRIALMNFHCTFYSRSIFEGTWYVVGPDILAYLKQLDFGDQGEAYHHVVDVLAAEYVKYWSLLTPDGRQYMEQISPDLLHRIKGILEQLT